MSDPFSRGSAPDRARYPCQRPGSFKPGHEKRGGRKKGTPNKISADTKKALLEAAYRVGSDGNGKDGIVGYFTWLGTRYPDFFYTEMLVRCLNYEAYELAVFGITNTHLQSTSFELNEKVRKMTELKLSWFRGAPNAQARLVEDLMVAAVQAPKTFAKMFCAAFLTPPKNWRARAARRAAIHFGVRSTRARP
jgi:hypothetical protein